MEQKKVKYIPLLRVLACFLILTAFLFMERSGIKYRAGNYEEAYVPAEKLVQMKACGDEKTCLLMVDSANAASANAGNQLAQILQDMRVPYETIDLNKSPLPELDAYQTAVAATPNLNVFGEDILRLCEWVGNGGRLMFSLPLEKNSMLDMISGKLGIVESGYANVMVLDIVFRDGFLLGGDEIFTITDAYEAASALFLDEQCEVYASTADGQTPLIWSRDYRDGKFVAVNFEYCEKAYRGIYASAYSLLEDVCIYPVIDASAFYIDDFPSPVPSGDGEYIRRDYNMEIGEFYSGVWWPDMVRIAGTHGMRYTGMIIENYNDQVEGELPRNKDTARYNYFGNTLLDMNGELGFHGYNHQPLCLDNFVYEEDLGYKYWESRDEMVRAVAELSAFSKDLFPGKDFSVYVPPSNVLSAEGREVIAEDFPEIRAIASTYFPGESAYDQEFEVAEDGIVETPRIISGCDINPYMKLAAISELNFHYVNSHFLHPDDLLDEDRGAALGWKELRRRWEDYLSWLYRSAPLIRNMTGSEIAGAIQRYCGVSLWKLDTPEDLYVTVDGLIDEARFFIRVNEGDLGAIKGGELTHLTGNLYLMRVTEPEIEIKRIR